MRDIHSGKNSTLKMIVNKQQAMEDSKMLDMDCLLEHKDNEYLFGMEGVERLADGMKRVGFKGAIEVWDLKNGTYLIYSGARRARANKLLGNERIRAFVYPYPESEAERRRQLLGANIYGRNAVRSDDPIHTARQISYLHDTIRMEREEGVAFGMKSRDILAKEFGTSPSNIYKYESLLKLNERGQEAVRTGDLQIAQGSSMSVLDFKGQDLVLDALEILRSSVGEISRERVQALVDFVKEHPDTDPDTAAIAAGKPEVKPARSKEGSSLSAPEAVSYTPKLAVRKFGQFYGKMEGFLRAPKDYEKKDRDDVLAKLNHLKSLVEQEIRNVEDAKTRD